MSDVSSPDPTVGVESGEELRLALQYASARFASARDELGNLRGQQIREEANHFLSAMSSGAAYSSAREQARAFTADLRDEVERAQAASDIWSRHLDALIAATNIPAN